MVVVESDSAPVCSPCSCVGCECLLSCSRVQLETQDCGEEEVQRPSPADDNGNPQQVNQARANLLDSMLASSTSSSDTEVDSDTADEEYKYQHLHEIHRVRRFKKAADREQCVVRYIPQHRPSILDRKDFYYRYGEKEQEAVASFDFLETMSTSVSDIGSVEILSDKSCSKEDGRTSVRNDNKSNAFENGRGFSYTKDDNRNYGSLHSLANEADLESRQFIEGRGILYDDFRRDMKFSAHTLTSQDGDTDERLSLSDSCAESFSCSTSNLNLEI